MEAKNEQADENPHPRDDVHGAAAVWRDDSQLARMVLSKAWGPRPYWEVRVAKLEVAG